MIFTKRLILLLLGLVVFAVSVSAQNASNSTNSTPLNFSSTECDAQCNNGSVDWSSTFACESGIPGAMYACCNNKTLCELRYNASCYNLVHLVPQVLPPQITNNSNPANNNNNNNNNNGGSGSSSSYSATDGGRRVMRLFVNGDTAGEPLFISANNIFGPMSGVKVLFFRDGSVVKTVELDGETEVSLDEPGRYVLEASRPGYFNTNARLYVYPKDDVSDVEEVDAPVEAPDPAPEPVVEEEDYAPLTSMSTVSVPKKSINWPKLMLLVVGLTGVLVFVYSMRSRGRKKEEPEKPDFGF